MVFLDLQPGMPTGELHGTSLVHSLGLSLMIFLDMPTGMPLGEHYSLLFYGYTAIYLGIYGSYS